jgi:hypothetical protein
MSVVQPVLDTVNEVQLMEWIRLVTDKLVEVEERFYVVDGIVIDSQEHPETDEDGGANTPPIQPPTLEIGEYKIQAVQFTDE